MTKRPYTMQTSRGITFLGNYLPRKCGIATFTTDLSDAVASQAGIDQPVIVAAINDNEEGYDYSDRVKFEIRRDNQVDYSRAADFLNFSGMSVLSLQHEFGIFGGTWGSNVLTLLRDVRLPIVVTCHTVLQNPDPVQREVFLEIAARADKLVVMSKKAFGFLKDIYNVTRDKIEFIPHGIHDVPFIDPNYYKDKFDVEGRRVLLTFGLLNRLKGIEKMIEALPAIVAKYPNTTYLVLGATHPAVIRKEGESYRLNLQRQVRSLGLEENVLFHPRFVETNELLEYIGATDVFVAPYLNLDQITSGALAYAAGAGKAIVATPFWHAEDLLDENRGRLVPPNDSQALADTLLDLFDHEIELNAMRKRMYTYCRSMVWSAVARSYLDLFEEVTSRVPKTFAMASATKRPLSPTNLPSPQIDHLVRLSDDTGPAHHARYTVPDWSYGYHLEDAAHMLVVSTKYNSMFKDAQAQRLSETCTALMQTLIGDGSNIAARLDYARHKQEPASNVDIARALWALGYVAKRESSPLAESAIDMFQRITKHASFNDAHPAAYAALGCANYLVRFPGASQIKRLLTNTVKIVTRFCKEPGWIDRWGDDDWPVATQVVAIAAHQLGNGTLKETAQTLAAELREATSNGTVFLKRGNNPVEEELPTTAFCYIDAIGAVLTDTKDEELIKSIRSAADWFLGDNRTGLAVYDFATGGCHDALTASGLNRNQGTKSSAHCLLAFLTLHRLASSDPTVKVSGEEKKA